MVHSTQTVHLSCVKISTISKQTRTSIQYEYHRVHTKWFLSLRYIWRKLCTHLALTLTMSPMEIHWVRPTTISKRMVRSLQTVHLSCVKISTISKQTETTIHLSHVTYEYHRVRTKWFKSLWYIWRKLCTHLALTLTRPLNWLKQDSTWPKSPRRSIGCVQQQFSSVWYVQRKPCTYLALRLALSPNGPKRASTWALSPSSTIRCVQNDFWAYGTFAANHAPIWHRY
jgi:hypothetical protein